jgi:hypothetical protein
MPLLKDPVIDYTELNVQEIVLPKKDFTPLPTPLPPYKGLI